MNIAKEKQDFKICWIPQSQTHTFNLDWRYYLWKIGIPVPKRIYYFCVKCYDSGQIMSRGWSQYCQMMEASNTINRVFVFSYYCHYRNTPNHYGFICDDPEVNSDANLPTKYKSLIGSFSLLVMQYMLKLSLPREATGIIHSCGNDGYAALQQIYL